MAHLYKKKVWTKTKSTTLLLLRFAKMDLKWMVMSRSKYNGSVRANEK